MIDSGYHVDRPIQKDNPEVDQFPANLARKYPDLIVVGGVHADGSPDDYAQSGPLVMVSAPSDLDAYNGLQCASNSSNAIKTASGTSYAAPAVAGLAAYFLSTRAELSWRGRVPKLVGEHIRAFAYRRGPNWPLAVHNGLSSNVEVCGPAQPFPVIPQRKPVPSRSVVPVRYMRNKRETSELGACSFSKASTTSTILHSSALSVSSSDVSSLTHSSLISAGMFSQQSQSTASIIPSVSTSSRISITSRAGTQSIPAHTETSKSVHSSMSSSFDEFAEVKAGQSLLYSLMADLSYLQDRLNGSLTSFDPSLISSTIHTTSSPPPSTPIPSPVLPIPPEASDEPYDPHEFENRQACQGWQDCNILCTDTPDAFVICSSLNPDPISPENPGYVCLLSTCQSGKR